MEKLVTVLEKRKNYKTENTDFIHTLDKIDFVIKLIQDNQLHEKFSLETKEIISFNTDEIANQIKNFLANDDEKYIQLINYYLSKIYSSILSEFDNLKALLIDRMTTIESDLSTTLKHYEDNISLIENSISSINKLESKSTALTNKIENSHKETTQIINKYIANIKEETEKRIDAKRVKIDKDLAKYQKSIENRIDSIVNSFRENVNSWDKKFDELEGKKSDFEETLTIATTYYKEARFDAYSEEQKKEANFYRKLSLQLMVTVVLIVLVITAWNIYDKNTEWHHYITRSVLVFTLMIPAIYTSRESANHRRNAEKYTQMANELRAFEATLKIDDLDKEIKNKIKEEIYKRYFGNILFEQKDIGDSFTSFFKDFLSREKK